MAESFGGDAVRYDRARPDYPDALVRRIVDAAPGEDVLDVGCGTGIAARQFRAAGCRVLGVEPDGRMAELARRSGLAVEVARFEEWEPGGRLFDAVVAGQAWHWVDAVAGAARAAQVLRPGGLFAPFWNVPRLPPEVAKALAAACRRVLPDLPFDVGAALARPTGEAYRGVLGRVTDGLAAAGGFGAPEEWRHDWERTYSRQAWLDQLPTFGPLTRLPADRLAEVLTQVGAAVGDRVGVRYTTVAVLAVRTA
ncbi:class I SAM-dependent methyltransferase [Streptomyces sp. NPDC057413]|uniref:class I SAM-dependent methyltransferase n=1 Tax=Streptomyces sp. NPDC057413 TaxID=3346124 RepID=UPI0036A94AB3